MKNVCEIVQDILPLYVDEICSPSSREFVQEHIAECEKCSVILDNLKRDTIDNSIKNEKNAILEKHFKNTKRVSFTIGIATAMILMIPLIVTFIVNIVTGHALTWFFIVLTSLLVAASVTVVPLVIVHNRFLYTSLSFVGTLILLLAVCCIYSHGRWFFIAAISVLLFAATVFLPIIVKNYLPNKIFWKTNKGLLVFIVDTILLYLLIVSINIFNKSVHFWAEWFPSLAITAVCVISAWIFFLIIRYWRVGAAARTGGALMYLGLFMMTINKIIDIIIGEPFPRSIFAKDNFINLSLSLFCIGTGLVLIIIYFLISKHKNKL